MTGAETITITRQEYAELIHFRSEVGLLKYQLAELKRLLYGTKSERYIARILPSLPCLAAWRNNCRSRGKGSLTSALNRSLKSGLCTEIPIHLPRRTEVIEPDYLPANAKRLAKHYRAVGV